MARAIPSGGGGGVGAKWSTWITVEELGPDRLTDIAARMAFPEFGLRTIEAAEKEEERIFASYGGKYVRTGKTRASLTESDAEGAIRHLTPGSFTFGTSIWYARFQGTTGQGEHSPPSALLKASALEAGVAATELRDYIMYGRQRGLV